MTFNNIESVYCRRLIHLALAEDLNQFVPVLKSWQVKGPRGDQTTLAIISEHQKGTAVIVARSDGVLAGLPATNLVFEFPELNLMRTTDVPESEFLSVETILEDGSVLHAGDPIARVAGPVDLILATERIALNFLQHLSGIATLTSRFVEAVKGLPCRIYDTRKTLPGWRFLEKYAVRCGGGYNHRMGLYDGVLIKDNHLAALGGGSEAIRQAVKAARERNRPDIPVEVEVENMDMLEVALDCQPNIILLDNMSLDQLCEAVRRRNEKSHKAELEASGGITLENVRAVAETGVDRISVGALTHSAPALDIALDYEPSV